MGIIPPFSAKNSSGHVTEETLFRSPIGMSKNAGPSRICQPISWLQTRKTGKNTKAGRSLAAFEGFEEFVAEICLKMSLGSIIRFVIFERSFANLA